MRNVLRINGMEVTTPVGSNELFNELASDMLVKLHYNTTDVPVVYIAPELMLGKEPEPSVIEGIMNGKAEGLIPAYVIWFDDKMTEKARMTAFIGTVKDVEAETSTQPVE